MNSQKKAASRTKENKSSARPKGQDARSMQSMLQSTLWFHEKQVMPLLSPFWAWRDLSR